MSHVTRTNESCHTYEWVMSHVWMCQYDAPAHNQQLAGYTQRPPELSLVSALAPISVYRSHVTHVNQSYEWVMSHVWTSHVTHMKESCHTYEGVTSHMLISHVSRMNELCHTYESVMSHIWTSHVANAKQSCHTYERVMSHMLIIRVTNMHESTPKVKSPDRLGAP